MRCLISRFWQPSSLVESGFGMIDQMGDAPLRNPGFTLSLSKEVFRERHHIVTQRKAQLTCLNIMFDWKTGELCHLHCRDMEELNLQNHCPNCLY